MSLQSVTEAFLNKPKETPPGEILRPSVTLFEWEAPDRVFKKHSREFYRRLAVIITFFALMLIFIKDFVVVVVLGVVFFVVYVFNTVPPKRVIHKITTNGVIFGSEHSYAWSELKSFFIEKRDGLDTLVIDTQDPLPGRIYFILDANVDKSKLIEEINKHISFQENPQKNIYEEFVRRIGSRMRI